MLRTTLAGLRARKLRLVATALAIVLGVGFVAGTLVFGDTAKVALYDQFARPAQGVDVAVRPVSAGRPPGSLPPSTVDVVRSVPGVAIADGRLREFLPLLDQGGKLVGNGDEPGLGVSTGTVAALRPYDVTAGRAPTAAGEAALDEDTVTRTGYAVGDEITVLDTNQARHALRMVGIVSFGTSRQYAGQAVVILPADELTRLTGSDGVREVVATAAPGTAAAELAPRVAAAVPGTTVRTGSQYRDDLATDAIRQFSSFLTVLLVFAVIACVVSTFVIYNTFTILIAQRVRELALLRCVGAARRQVFGAVLLESVVVGLVGSVLGLGVGLGLGFGLFSGFTALGAPLPEHALVLTGRSVAIAGLLGVFVTVVAALGPAARATRVAPVAALRPTGLTTPQRRRGRLKLAIPAVLAGGLGTLLTVVGSRTEGDAETATLLVVAGGIVNFLAVLLLSPLFVGPVTGAIGWLPGRILGPPARLAVAGARSNPGRTAATTATLMIGVGLMAAASVTLATVRVTATEQLRQHYPVDYILLPSGAGPEQAGIPAAVAQGLRERPELPTVAQVRVTPGTMDGHRLIIGATDPAGLAVLAGAALPLAAGSIADFGAGTTILFTDAAQGHRVGDTVALSTPDGHSGQFRVAALAVGQSQTGDALVSWNDFAALHPVTSDDLVLIRAADGVTPAASRLAVESVTNAYPLVEVNSLADWRAEITSSVDLLIGLVAALLAVAIVIALIGIMNTLSLSVLERTRESATLRALGLTRGQLRATLLIEALLMGILGALVGVSFGLLYGWLTTRVIFSGFPAIITVPVGQLLAYVALAALAAAVAAVLPARKAARTSVVSAMAET